jgi:hypothetical protein
MGQRANSGRNASLDQKKSRAAGRKQNDPAREAITGRQEAPPVPGAFGKEGRANRRGNVATFVAGDTGGGAAVPKTGPSTRPARKRDDGPARKRGG